MNIMKNVLDWKTKNEFVIDDASFVIDLSTGYNNRRLSMNNSFTIVKTLDFLNVYCDVASNYSGLNNILELGIFQGGGFVFLIKYLIHVYYMESRYRIKYLNQLTNI